MAFLVKYSKEMDNNKNGQVSCLWVFGVIIVRFLATQLPKKYQQNLQISACGIMPVCGDYRNALYLYCIRDIQQLQPPNLILIQ